MITLPGKLYPVEIEYLPKEADYKYSMLMTLKSLISLILFEEEGNILVYLSTDQDFNYYLSALKENLAVFYEELGPVTVTFIYSDYVSPIFCKEQETLNSKSTAKPERKLYLISTTCEFHLINNIKFVVDCGWEMRKVWSPTLVHNINFPTRISTFDSNLRGMTAGTLVGGKCYRMYTKATMDHEMHLIKPPELEYKDLTKALLFCKQLGSEWHQFGLMSKTNLKNYNSCVTFLKYVKAIDSEVRWSNLRNTSLSSASLSVNCLCPRV